MVNSFSLRKGDTVRRISGDLKHLEAKVITPRVGLNEHDMVLTEIRFLDSDLLYRYPADALERVKPTKED